MGSAASSPSLANEELKSLHEHLKAQETRSIQLFDLPQLQDQQQFTFKKHKDVIIKILCNRSKDYLSRLVLEFNHEEYIKLLGDSQYGKFLFLITKSSLEVDLEFLEITLTGLGINEIGICCLLGVMDRYDIEDLSAAFLKKYSCSLTERIEGKVKKDSVIATFFSCVLKADRDETDYVNDSTVSDIATEIHTKLSAFHVSRDHQNQVIRTLCSSSRKQCKAVALEFEQKFNKTLESVINSVYSKALSFGLNSYISATKYQATGYILANTKESSFYEYLIAKYDKAYIEKVDSASKSKFLAKLTGNFKIAVETYMKGPKDCPCQGNLDYMYLYLKELRSSTGKDIGTLIADSNSEEYEQIKNFLNNGITAFHNYLNEQDIIDQPKNNKGPKSKKFSRSIESYEMKEKLVCEYLRAQFDLFDHNNGALDDRDFWMFITSLPMNYLGFTDEEVLTMKDFCDWDNDSMISIDEVNGELAEMIITALDSMDDQISFKEKVDVLYQKTSTNNSQQGAKNKNSGEQKLAPDLITYLKSTFKEYDVDNSGTLDYNEYWNLLQCLNLGIGDSDYDAVLAKWDVNSDGLINWAEALEQFTVILKQLASDKRDHFIGLVDPDTKCLFWYNLRDSSSTWFSAEDNEAYKPHHDY